MSQILSVSQFTVAAIPLQTQPNNPPTGTLYVYADSTSGALTTVTSTGTVSTIASAATNVSTAPAGDIITSNGSGAIQDSGLLLSAIPQVVAKSLLTAQSAAISATTIYAIPGGKAGLYRINYVATVTTAGTTSTLGGATGFQAKFTNGNADSVVKTSTPTTPNISATDTTATTISGSVYGYCAASTNLQYLFGYTSSGTTMVYDLAIYVEYLG